MQNIKLAKLPIAKMRFTDRKNKQTHGYRVIEDNAFHYGSIRSSHHLLTIGFRHSLVISELGTTYACSVLGGISTGGSENQVRCWIT